MPATLEVRGSRIENNESGGIVVLSSSAVVDGTLVLGSLAVDSRFGDGIVVTETLEDLPAGSVEITRSRIEGSARAGVAAFGASLALTATVLECNAIDLDGEAGVRGPYAFEDGGDNACGCGDAPVTCQVLSSSLEPPSRVDLP